MFHLTSPVANYSTAWMIVELYVHQMPNRSHTEMHWSVLLFLLYFLEQETKTFQVYLTGLEDGQSTD